MIQRAQRAGLVLSVNHSARMDPGVLKALDGTQSGFAGCTGSGFFSHFGLSALSRDRFLRTIGTGRIRFRPGFAWAIPVWRLSLSHSKCRRPASGPLAETHPVLRLMAMGLVLFARGTGRMYISWNVRLPRKRAVSHGTRGLDDGGFLSCKLRGEEGAARTAGGSMFLGRSGATRWRILTNAARRLAVCNGKLLSSPEFPIR